MLTGSKIIHGLKAPCTPISGGIVSCRIHGKCGADFMKSTVLQKNRAERKLDLRLSENGCGPRMCTVPPETFIADHDDVR